MKSFSRLLPMFAIAIGVALVAVTSAFKEAPKNKLSNQATYYFQFTGSNGQEDDPTQWTEISQSAYLTAGCPGAFRGCALATTSVSGSGSNLHPTQVDVDVDPSDPMDNKSPITGDGVIQVKNRATSY